MIAQPRRISGIVTALVTPLDSSGRLDRAGLERLIARQERAGVDGIFILGSVGEGPLVDDAVGVEVARQARAAVQRCVLLGGASDNSVARCLRRLEDLAAAGVEYGVLTLPYYGWPADGPRSVAFFAEVAARSPLPIVAYNLPNAVGWQMPVAVLEELFAIPNVICIKDTHGDFAQMRAVASSPRRPAHFSYLPGNSALAPALLAHGADGVVSTPSNILPEPFVDLWRWQRAGRTDLVRRLEAEVFPAVTGLLTLAPTGAAALKGLLEIEGVCRRHTVAPWPCLQDADVAAWTRALAAARAVYETFLGTLDPADRRVIDRISLHPCP